MHRHLEKAQAGRSYGAHVSQHVLVTGGAGFIGSLVDRIIARGDGITVLDDRVERQASSSPTMRVHSPSLRSTSATSMPSSLTSNRSISSSIWRRILTSGSVRV